MFQQVFDQLRIDGVVDPRPHLDVARVDPSLPSGRRRDDRVRADQLAPVHVITEGRGEQAQPVAAFAEDAVGLLEDGHAGPFEPAGVDRDPALFEDHLQPVVQPADHDRADRAHRCDLLALDFTAAQTALHRLGDGDALRQRETDRCVDADAAIRGLFDRRDPGSRGWNLHDHVLCQAAKGHGVLHDGAGISEETWICLDRQPAIAASVRRECGLEQVGRLDGHLLDEPPADLVLGRARHLAQQRLDARSPLADVLLEDRDRDHRVAGRADRPVVDRVGELLDVRRVVPQTCGSRLRHLVEGTPVSHLASRYHRVTTTFLRV